MNKLGVKIAIIGGGTGSFTLLSELKNYTHNITALVSMADDGGSTGKLRDELGVLPAGDIRQCLVALSGSPKVRDLFNYRFSEGGMKGHVFGNLFMAALEKITDSYADAVDTASEVLNTVGRVEPMTLDNTKLSTKMSDGTVISGENNLEEFTIPEGERPELSLVPRAQINPDARKAILEADQVVIAPGSIYGSLAPALLVDGVTEALNETEARIIYVCNLVNKPGETKGFTVCDFAEEIERFAGVKLDYVLYNNHRPAPKLMEKYAHSGELAVEWDENVLSGKHYTAIGKRFVADTPQTRGDISADPLASERTFIRHDADQVARELMRIYFA